MTALGNVASGPRRVRRTPRAPAEKEGRVLLAKIGREMRARHRPSPPFGGQPQRRAIARALVLRPLRTRLDQPASALDLDLRQEVPRAVRSLAEDGGALVATPQGTSFRRKVGTRPIFMEGRQIAVERAPLAMLGDSPRPRLRAFLRHVD